jgi:hypothetical protein
MNKISARALQWVLQFKGNCTTVAPAAGINVFPQRCVRHLATQRRGRRVDQGETLQLRLQLLLHRQGIGALGKASRRARRRRLPAEELYETESVDAEEENAPTEAAGICEAKAWPGDGVRRDGGDAGRWVASSRVRGGRRAAACGGLEQRRGCGEADRRVRVEPARPHTSTCEQREQSARGRNQSEAVTRAGTEGTRAREGNRRRRRKGSGGEDEETSGVSPSRVSVVS